MKQMYITECNVLATTKKKMKTFQLNEFNIEKCGWILDYENAVELYVRGIDLLEALNYIKTIERYTYFNVCDEHNNLVLSSNDKLALVRYDIQLPLLTHSKNNANLKIKLSVEYLLNILKEYPKNSFRKQNQEISLKQGFDSSSVKLLLKEDFPVKIQVMGDIYILAPCVDN